MTRRRFVGVCCGLNLGLIILAIFLAQLTPPSLIEVTLNPAFGVLMLIIWIGMFWGMWRD